MIKYKGYTYQPSEDREDDNVKTYHDVLTPTGQEIAIPLSPYAHLTQAHFEKWVLLGCPTERKTIIRNAVTHSFNWDLNDIDQAFSQLRI
jgi:hypothetical protein